MRIYAIDDEPKMLRMLHDAIAEAEPSAEILDFSRAPEVMEALSDPGKNLMPFFGHRSAGNKRTDARCENQGGCTAGKACFRDRL